MIVCGVVQYFSLWYIVPNAIQMKGVRVKNMRKKVATILAVLVICCVFWGWMFRAGSK